MIPASVKPYLGYVLAAALLAAAAGGFLLGFSLAQARGDAALAAERQRQADARALAAAAARKTETDLRTELHALEQRYTTLEQEADRERQADARLISDLRAGTRRMSIAVSRCGPGVPGGATPDDESGADSAPRAELDPEAAEALLAIARDGDRYIRERNACIEQYEIVRRRLNSQPGATGGKAVGE